MRQSPIPCNALLSIHDTHKCTTSLKNSFTCCADKKGEFCVTSSFMFCLVRFESILQFVAEMFSATN